MDIATVLLTIEAPVPKITLLAVPINYVKLQVWSAPLDVTASPSSPIARMSSRQWQMHTQVAWDFDPRLAFALLSRCVWRWL